MTWVQRLRDMVLAGGAGALTVVGCTSNKSYGFCCNGSMDPCCESRYCGEPMTVECMETMACEAEGGMLHGVAGCVHPGPSDASDTPEVEPSDAGADGDSQPD
jgi:hypothetical protein